MSTVPSVDPESTTTISCAHRTLSSVRGRLAASFNVISTTESVFAIEPRITCRALAFLAFNVHLGENGLLRGFMRNIIFSAEGGLIERARTLAQANGTTLNAEFRRWLQQYTAAETGVENFEILMRDMRHVNACGRISRDELNQR
jgi:hypothetical protein